MGLFVEKSLKTWSELCCGAYRVKRISFMTVMWPGVGKEVILGCDVTYLKVCVWNMGSLRCLVKNKCQNRVPGHPIYKVGHNLTGFNNILEGGILDSPFKAAWSGMTDD